MAWPHMIEVTKEEFESFVKAYPSKLHFDITGISEPPYASYNDFTLGDWPSVCGRFLFQVR
jgi:hypothetical protein